MRIMIDPNNPVAIFELTPWDMGGTGNADIVDFLAVLQHGYEEIRQGLLNYCGIMSINMQGANPFSPNTKITMQFGSREGMMKYLKGEETGDKSLYPDLGKKIKDFLDERDKLQAGNGR